VLRDDAGGRPDLRLKILDAAAALASYAGDHDRARALLDEEIGLARSLGDAALLAFALANAVFAATLTADEALGFTVKAEAEALLPAVADPWLRGIVLRNLAGFALAAGDAARAEVQADAALDLLRPVGDPNSVAVCAIWRAEAAELRRDVAGAVARLREALELSRPVADGGVCVSFCAQAAGRFALACGRSDQAARLLGGLDVLSEAQRVAWPPADYALAWHVAEVRAALGESSYAASWAAGRTGPLAAVVEAVLDELAAEGGAGAVSGEGAKPGRVEGATPSRRGSGRCWRWWRTG
jgi:hypothetical protein